VEGPVGTYTQSGSLHEEGVHNVSPRLLGGNETRDPSQNNNASAAGGGVDPDPNNKGRGPDSPSGKSSDKAVDQRNEDGEKPSSSDDLPTNRSGIRHGVSESGIPSADGFNNFDGDRSEGVRSSDRTADRRHRNSLANSEPVRRVRACSEDKVEAGPSVCSEEVGKVDSVCPDVRRSIRLTSSTIHGARYIIDNFRMSELINFEAEDTDQIVSLEQVSALEEMLGNTRSLSGLGFNYVIGGGLRSNSGLNSEEANFSNVPTPRRRDARYHTAAEPSPSSRNTRVEDTIGPHPRVNNPREEDQSVVRVNWWHILFNSGIAKAHRATVRSSSDSASTVERTPTPAVGALITLEQLVREDDLLRA
jgi:hypothetical protein